MSRAVSLVTGGAGFVGSHLVRKLIKSGSEVIIIDDLSTGHVRNLETAISSGRATFVHADVAVPVTKLQEILIGRKSSSSPKSTISRLRRVPKRTMLIRGRRCV